MGIPKGYLWEGLADHAQRWLETVLDQKGNPCGNCGTWRPLKDREITFCAVCGDDAYDVYELAESAEDLPATKGEVTKESLIMDARRIVKNINQIFIDAAHWNRIHPTETPIDPDPEGVMAKQRDATQRWLDQIVNSCGYCGTVGPHTCNPNEVIYFEDANE